MSIILSKGAKAGKNQPKTANLAKKHPQSNFPANFFQNFGNTLISPKSMCHKNFTGFGGN
jgi:hypothetical protein